MQMMMGLNKRVLYCIILHCILIVQPFTHTPQQGRNSTYRCYKVAWENNSGFILCPLIIYLNLNNIYNSSVHSTHGSLRNSAAI